MLDMLLFLGSGSLSACILKGLLKNEETNSNIAGMILAFSFLNFIFMVLIGKILGIAPMIHSQYGTVLQMSSFMLVVSFIASIINAFIVAFVIKRLNIGCECTKVKED